MIFRFRKDGLTPEKSNGICFKIKDSDGENNDASAEAYSGDTDPSESGQNREAEDIEVSLSSAKKGCLFLSIFIKNDNLNLKMISMAFISTKQYYNLILSLSFYSLLARCHLLEYCDICLLISQLLSVLLVQTRLCVDYDSTKV